ncbi:hypothetical protein N7478_013381 [Penicillium angulare]|uniref:uncharacterized protein n=1 Tax=Penicillium angulare TaxID=116970 RepID=UPI0025421168|nr:uncharacterized protein N7478_013381 [Penicillium angulare]KAJ5257277.1 hypothetical protein N7478_013381 [Penicillium angulare]
MGRHNGGRAQWEDARVEEIISDNEDVFGREMMRGGRYMRQQEYGGRSPRRRLEYGDLTDETESVMDGGDYDLYDHEDSVVAYAVQLAMRDKEDQLVDQALERIRRAQVLGKSNVRLSKSELAALERKRQQTDTASASGMQRNRKGSGSNSRPSSRRNGHTVPLEQQQQQFQPPQMGPYPPFAPPDAQWNRTASRPSSSSSANRPRTPTMQSLRPQQSISPLRPAGFPSFPDRMPPNARPQSMQQPLAYPRPLPDDPSWAPPYYNPMQMNSYASEQPQYQSQLPAELRVGPQSRMSYPAGMSPIQAQHRQSVNGRRRSSGTSQPQATPPESEEETSSEEETEDSDDSDVQIVRVVERQAAVPVPAPVQVQVPAPVQVQAQTQAQPSPGLQRRRVSGGKQGRQRTKR